MSDTEDPDWDEASPEVLHIAEMLIKKYHRYLENARILFVFRKEAQPSKGHRTLGQVSKIPAKFQPFLEYDFMVWLSREDFYGMTSRQREAMIDHELCHIRMGGNGLALIGHDFEEFYEIIERYGFWDQRLKRIDRELTSYQMSLGLQIESAMGKIGTVGSDALKKASAEAETVAKPEPEPAQEETPPAPVDHQKAADDLLKGFLEEKKDEEEDDEED